MGCITSMWASFLQVIRKGAVGNWFLRKYWTGNSEFCRPENHGVFKLGSAEHLRFSGICNSYIAKDFSPGTAFMLNPVMSSGHSMLVSILARKCEDKSRGSILCSDDPDFIDRLYNGQLILREGCLVARPTNPSLEWHIEDLQFGILDKETMVFFSIFPFFAR